MTLALVLVSGMAWAITKDCRAGADYCMGTNDPDTLDGSEEGDKIYGKNANDRLFGNGGNDTLRGGEDNDTEKGGAGRDNLGSGEPGDDKLYGGAQADHIVDYSYDYAADTDDLNVLSGGGGDDYLYGHNRLDGGPGDDDIEAVSQSGGFAEGGAAPRTLTGGSGNDHIVSTERYDDTIYARDGERDRISCGGGEDTVYFDKGIDEVNPINCEHRIGK